jgi:DNA uptake protein ComE-like DNA-binding protein
VNRYCRSGLALLSLTALICLLPACSSRSRAQTQSQQDQEEREKVANATQKAKQESQKAALQLREATQQAEHDAKVAAQGVKEGWNRDQQGRLDLNAATVADLRSLSLSDSQAKQIVDGRPYADKHELVVRGILTEAQYNSIRDQITVRAPAGQQ